MICSLPKEEGGEEMATAPLVKEGAARPPTTAAAVKTAIEVRIPFNCSKLAAAVEW